MRKIEIHLCINLSPLAFLDEEIRSKNPTFSYKMNLRGCICGFFCSYFENVLYALYEPIKFRSIYSRNRVRMQNLFSILWHFHLPNQKLEENVLSLPPNAR